MRPPTGLELRSPRPRCAAPPRSRRGVSLAPPAPGPRLLRTEAASPRSAARFTRPPTLCDCVSSSSYRNTSRRTEGPPQSRTISSLEPQRRPHFGHSEVRGGREAGRPCSMHVGCAIGVLPPCGEWGNGFLSLPGHPSPERTGSWAPPSPRPRCGSLAGL